MKNFLVKKLEKALNQYLSLDPESNVLLSVLHEKVITIELVGLNVVLQLIFTQQGVRIKNTDFLKPDTTIKSTPFTLMRMALTQGDRKHFFSKDVSIEGNLEVGQQIMDLFDQLEIDWEEYLSQWIGDVPAHQIGRAQQAFKRFRQRIEKVLSQNINEYVHEEADLFPSHEALQDFFSDVDSLTMDLDRIEARVKILKKLASNDEEKK